MTTDLAPLDRIEIDFAPLIERCDPFTARRVQYVVWVFFVEGGLAWIWEGSDYETALLTAENLRARHPGVSIFHWGTKLRADG